MGAFSQQIKWRRTTAAALLCGWFCIAVLTVGDTARARQISGSAQATTESGVKLYQQGNYKEAIKTLKAVVKQNKGDAEAWHHLGLAYAKEDNVKEAIKSFREAIRLRARYAPSYVSLATLFLLGNKTVEAEDAALAALRLDARNAEAYVVYAATRLRIKDHGAATSAVNQALKINPQMAPAWFIKYQTILDSILHTGSPTVKATVSDGGTMPLPGGNRYREAAEALAEYLRLQPNVRGIGFWQQQLTELRFWGKSPDERKPEEEVVNSKELTTKARITVKPDPKYTTEARRAGVSGIVILRLVLSRDGRVKHIVVLNDLGYALTESAVEAARRIEFIPATKDGRLVSQIIQVEYGFFPY